MRIMRITLQWVLLLSFTCSLGWSQGSPLSLEVFAEAGGSFITNTATYTPTPICQEPCTSPSGRVSFSDAGRFFGGARFRTGHDAIEASYSYSPNPGADYNRLDLFSFNYVRYLWLRSKVQPFATIGLGANRFSGPSNPSAGFDFVWNYGGGADIALRRHFALRLELRDYVGGQPNGFVGTSHNIVPTAGIVFRFR